MCIFVRIFAHYIVQIKLLHGLPGRLLGSHVETSANLAVFLFDARGKSGVTSRAILNRLDDLFDHISSERRIVMDDAGKCMAYACNGTIIFVSSSDSSVSTGLFR